MNLISQRIQKNNVLGIEQGAQSAGHGAQSFMK